MIALSLLLTGCDAEKRALSASQPSSPPTGADDPRAALIEQNVWQVSQGGRLFGWYGCDDCHGQTAQGMLNLADDQWRRGGRPGQVYGSIASGPAHAYSPRIVDEQLWQLTAFVRSLKDLPADRRNRQDMDLAGEPSAARWEGPLQ